MIYVKLIKDLLKSFNIFFRLSMEVILTKVLWIIFISIFTKQIFKSRIFYEYPPNFLGVLHFSRKAENG